MTNRRTLIAPAKATLDGLVALVGVRAGELCRAVPGLDVKPAKCIARQSIAAEIARAGCSTMLASRLPAGDIEKARAALAGRSLADVYAEVMAHLQAAGVTLEALTAYHHEALQAAALASAPEKAEVDQYAALRAHEICRAVPDLHQRQALDIARKAVRKAIKGGTFDAAAAPVATPADIKKARGILLAAAMRAELAEQAEQGSKRRRRGR